MHDRPFLSIKGSKAKSYRLLKRQKTKLSKSQFYKTPQHGRLGYTVQMGGDGWTPALAATVGI